ncbi:MAG: hypothetical protein HY870_02295 [Chloroflexi bacterium]|nr:hypothetical protein [Chloroflexota bacterium]
MTDRPLHSTSSHDRQRGQAIVIIAMGFILLLGFTGLVVDVARVFVARGNLRRAVDSAGLAAAAQFRQNATVADIQQAATQFLYAHGLVADTQSFFDMAVVTSTVRIETCDTVPGDAVLCPPDANHLRRKLVRVKAEADVSMSFLQILGVQTTRIYAENLAEAAAVDVVLVIDASVAQAYDAPSMDAYANQPGLGCNPEGLAAIGLDSGLYTNACVAACNAYPDPSNARSCQPFGKVKEAAIRFIDQLYPQYDRVAVISIDRDPQIVFPLGLDLNAAKTAIRNMRVSDHTIGDPGDPCPTINVGGERWKCTTSNMGFALRAATAQFGTPPFRDDSLWVVITVGSGGADSTEGQPSAPDLDTQLFGLCPDKDAQPFCRDNRWATHHISTTANYDAEDYAYDKATYLGLAPDKSAPTQPNGGLGVLMFSIGLGRKVVCTGGYSTYTVINGVVTCVPAPGSPYVDPDTGYPNLAESFLRYVAYIGSTGDPTQSDPCAGAPLGQQCGNYYFAPDAAGLEEIFLAIAGKIFTRISG